jgi:hypothetical protein
MSALQIKSAAAGNSWIPALAQVRQQQVQRPLHSGVGSK